MPIARAALLIVPALLAIVTSGCAPQVRSEPKEKAVDYFVRGQVFEEKGDVEAALAELRKAVKVDPDLSIAHAAIGDIYRHRGDWELARRAYESACQTNPFAFAAHYNLGLTYQTLAQTSGVAEKVEQYLKKAVELYLRAITLKSDDFDSNLNLSACYFQLGQLDDAEKYCRAAAEIDPKSAKAMANLATIKDSKDELYEAIKAYKASLELDMQQPEILINLGSAYMRQGRLKEALRSFEQAASEDPNSSVPLEKAGACHFYMRQFDEAKENYQKALELDPKSAAAHRGLGVAYMSQFIMDSKRTDMRDKALEEWNASLDIQPDQEDLRKLVQKYTPPLEAPKLSWLLD